MFLPLAKLVRCLLAISIASGSATAASIARASMTCIPFDEFPAVSDPSIRDQLETHVRGLPGLKNPRVRSLDRRSSSSPPRVGFAKTSPVANIVSWTCGMAWSGTSLPFEERA
jgi:hypothetical protein